MNLSGTLSDWTVADLLNVMKVTAKTASLHVRGKREGTIHFREGRVVGAGLDGKPIPTGEFESRMAASDTLFFLAALHEGRFEVGPFEGPEAEGWDVDSLLSDMEHLNGLETELAGAGMRRSFLMLRDEVDKPVTVEVDDWWALASLVSVLSFDQLEEVFGRGRAIRLLHALWRMDLIEAIDESEEAETTEPELPHVDLSKIREVASEEDHETQDPSTISERDDESWLDEIAAAAGPATATTDVDPVEARRVMGVAAPASTVLTGSVLDEMRRLRVRPTD